MTPGFLYIVATPIGNLKDITFRAIETLNQVDAILCEDTRVTAKLLAHYKIQKKLISYHHHSDAKKLQEIASLILNGQNLALVTDAGTPGISDPGNELINHLKNKLPVNAIVGIPGPAAAIMALSVSGFKTDKFTFLGFPPHKNKRQKFFQEVAGVGHTVVFYESSHRIKKCLNDLAAVLKPTQNILLGRELTKKFETIYRGSISELLSTAIDERGEFTVVISS